MSKITMKFDGETEHLKAMRALKADSVYSVIHEMFDSLRYRSKYSEIDSEAKEADYWYDRLNDILNERGIDIDTEYP